MNLSSMLSARVYTGAWSYVSGSGAEDTCRETMVLSEPPAFRVYTG